MAPVLDFSVSVCSLHFISSVGQRVSEEKNAAEKPAVALWKVLRLETSLSVIKINHSNNNNNQLSDSNDYDCILVMLLGSRRNGRLEVNPFSLPTTSRTVSVIRKDAKRNTSELTAPGSLNF